MVAIFLWAFACGTPLLLITSTLSLRLAQARLSLTEIGLFGLAVIPYALKIFFAPFIENITPIVLGAYVGRVRAWMLYAMIGISIGIFLMAVSPLHSKREIYEFFAVALFTGFCGAINDTAEAEYRIELLEHHELSFGTAYYLAGFTLGELMAGGGAILIASYSQWKTAYSIMLIPLIIGIITVCAKKHNRKSEQIRNAIILHKKIYNYSLFIKPIKNLFQHIQSKWIVFIIFFYYMPSYLLLMIMNPFYLHLKFSTYQIGLAKGIPSLLFMLIGSFIGGYCCQRYGILKGLVYSLFGYFINILILLLLVLTLHSFLKPSYGLLFLSILFTTLIDSISVVFYITLIASECRTPYTASQNAFFTSLMAVSKAIFASLGGVIAQHMGYENTFILLSLVITFLGIGIYRLSVSHPLKQLV